jgi:hypothetical protein
VRRSAQGRAKAPRPTTTEALKAEGTTSLHPIPDAWSEHGILRPAMLSGIRPRWGCCCNGSTQRASQCRSSQQTGAPSLSPGGRHFGEHRGRRVSATSLTYEADAEIFRNLLPSHQYFHGRQMLPRQLSPPALPSRKCSVDLSASEQRHHAGAHRKIAVNVVREPWLPPFCTLASPTRTGAKLGPEGEGGHQN